MALLANLLVVPDRFSPAARTIGRAYAFRFWRPSNGGEWLDLVAAFLLWPLAVVVCIIRYTHRNGRVVAGRFGRPIALQIADQLRLCVTSALFPPWYYIFELYRPGRMAFARGYVTRGETKHGAYPLLADARGSTSPLSDKEEFARFCSEHQISTLPVLLSAHKGELRWNGLDLGRLPKRDLFVKPVSGRGGRGAERWDYAYGGKYRHPTGRTLSGNQLLERLCLKSQNEPVLVQERVRNHPAISDLSNGALNTVRMISCLDERERPELIGAVLRIAVGSNVTVDNVHAGGLAAAIDLDRGILSAATDMGVDANLGWVEHHRGTGARIAGRVLPHWEDLCQLVRRAHSSFGDRVVIGWDVAITAQGPRIVEGNSGPDVDLIQRPLQTPFCNSRLGELLALHLDRSEQQWRASRR